MHSLLRCPSGTGAVRFGDEDLRDQCIIVTVLPTNHKRDPLTARSHRGGAMVMANVGENGGLELDKDFYIEFPKGYRSHQIRLEGGDCSTDSFCYPSV